MKKEYGNIFKLARQEAGLTQEVACGLLLIKDRTTLSRYENDQVIPNDELVYEMMNVYRAKWLGYEYFRLYTKIGRAIFPPIFRRKVGHLTLMFKKERDDLIDIERDLVRMTYDDVITEDEEEEWRSSTKEIQDVVAAGMSLLLVDIEKEPSQGCNLERAIV